MAKLIVIEGTDCSGKETQSDLLFEHLLNDDIKIVKKFFPNYDSPTGKIVGGPYLGKNHISNGYFNEGAVNVDPKVASLYYAADRLYNIKEIKSLLDNGVNVLLDRYVQSNMAHQGAKLTTPEERLEMYRFLEKLEYELLELPRPDCVIFLHMPYQQASKLKSNRSELPDQHEASSQHLRQAEAAYLEMAKLYDFEVIKCVDEGKIKSKEETHQEVYKRVRQHLIK